MHRYYRRCHSNPSYFMQQSRQQLVARANKEMGSTKCVAFILLYL